MLTPLKRKASTLAAVASALLIVFVTGCSSPIPLSRSAKNTGTLSISVPRIASWVHGQAKAQASGSRAYIIADAVKVEVKTAGGEVVTSALVNWTMGTDYNPAAQKVMSDITGIPVGTDYTIVVSIYNHVMSSDEPQVQGEVTGVTVTDGAITPVSVVCKPVNPVTLTIDGGYVSAPIAPNGERWYVANLTAGQAYYVESYTPTAFFDQNGVMILPFNVPHVATYTGPLYIGVVDFDGFANLTAIGYTKLLLSTSLPNISEGTVGSPVSLTPNSDHEFNLSGSSANTPSYYTFTATEDGVYSFDSELSGVSYSLYTDSSFTGTPVASGSWVQQGGTLGSLVDGTPYYLALTNPSNNTARAKGRVMTPSGIAAATLSEGTSGAPVALTLASAETGTVGYHVFDSMSYYSFTTDGNGHTDVALTIPAPSDTTIKLALSDTPITSEWGYDFNTTTSTGDHLYAQLTPNTTYYLRVGNDFYSGSRRDISVNYSITVTCGSSPPAGASEGTPGSPVPLSLNTEHTFRVGASGSGYNSSYYKFETTDPGNYAVDYEGGTVGALLYSDPDFTVSLGGSGEGYGREFSGLSGATTYYLRLFNSSTVRMERAGRLVDGITMTTSRVNDGSMASPVQLTLGSPQSGRVGKYSYDYLSYYSFQTGAGVDYLISAPNGNGRTLAELFTDADFSVSFNTFYVSTNVPVHEVLLPNTTYYLRIKNTWMSLDQDVSYTIQVAAESTPTFVPLPVQDSFTAGTIGSPGSVVWYEADVTGGQDYLLYWTSGTVGPISAWVFKDDRSTAYFRGFGSHNSPWTITVPADQTKLYVQLRVPNGYSNTGTFTIKLKEKP